MKPPALTWLLGSVIALAVGMGLSSVLFSVPEQTLQINEPPELFQTSSQARPLLINGNAEGSEQPETNSTPPRFQFVEQAASAGVRFLYYGNPSPEHPMTEQNGGGIALLDYDRDGGLDLFFTNGSHFQRPAQFPEHSQKLFRYHGAWRYSDDTLPTRLEQLGFGMGAAAGDFDNDGFPDLYVATYGPNHLWRNNGDGTFTEATDIAHVGDDRWGSSAAWADLDGDGDLDLYVVNYVQWAPSEPPCYTQHQPHPVHISCGPLGRAGQPDVVYENLGDGTFADRSEHAGVNLPDGKGLDVVIADLDDNGRLDLYVANDTTENHLFLNAGSWKFSEQGIPNGCAVSDNGTAQSSMGIALGDTNDDGRFDLGVTNFENEVNDFYLGLGGGQFRPANRELGLNPLSRSALGFGTLAFDADSDHYPELFIANGHVWDLRSLGLNHQFEMPPQLLTNEQGQRFRDDSARAGRYFQKRWLGRSVAQGDLDNDGDPDLAISHLIAPAELLRNDSPHTNRTVRVEFIGTRNAREPRGCTVRHRLGMREWTTWIPSGGGYQASSDPRAILVVDQATIIDAVSIIWPDGTRETWSNIPVADSQAESQTVRMVEGTGVVAQRSQEL